MLSEIDAARYPLNAQSFILTVNMTQCPYACKNSLITNSLRALISFNDYIHGHSHSQTAVSLNEIS